ncbi:hypothetical protein OIU79_018330 [Salix purpurea]|uniref:Transcriptional coactivator p15 (PC4) C-terminal domain-containing protein n=1 Tax=Salix purpurea TaxID=77065 RepID=A0A9Q1AKU5_SALPP|nr:hypothetical protein OIU79_018330 [Salix purpurea]
MSGRGGKRAAAAREEEEGGAEDNFAQQQPPAKKYAKPDNSSSDNSDDIVVCEIGRNRRVTVRNWRGKINVDIRKLDSAPFQHDISVKIPVSNLIPKPFRWLRLRIKIVLEALMSKGSLNSGNSDVNSLNTLPFPKIHRN